MSQAMQAPSPSPLAQRSGAGRPLCVDLDGTLVRTDTLWESVVVLLTRRPWLMLVLPVWLLAGRARFKREVAERVTLDAGSLPYREDLLTILRDLKANGQTLVLATAADRGVAEAVAAHLGLFERVFASDGSENLKAERKQKRLVEAYGQGGFDYIGDSGADLAIFTSAEHGFLVGTTPSTASRAQRLNQKVVVLSLRPSVLKAVLKQLRMHQWAKNALVLLPLVLSPQVPSTKVVLSGLLAALVFSLCASAGYVFNDLLDLPADRVHKTKRERPLASGALPVVLGPPLFVGLLAASFGLSQAFLSLGFTLMLAVYFVGTMAYSLDLKTRLLLDVLVLAGLYTHRILAGGIATQVPISAWLLGFSMFFFLSLAFAKRYVELLPLAVGAKIKNRAYYKTDLHMIASMGPASGYLAALVFSLYVESGSHQGAYREPTLLWLAVPVLLYWISRVWIVTGRGEMQDDPVKFALKDRLSWLCAVMIAGVAALARFAPAWLTKLLHG